MWRLEEVIAAVEGTVFRTEGNVFTGISTDSRTISSGELFVPIVGTNFDGHAFIKAAHERSHGGAFCEKKRKDIFPTLPGTVILVEDTTQALLDLARCRRNRLKTTCIAITGSNGKTTTKEILVHIMKGIVSVHFNEKNYNNLIGVPKSILAIEGQPQFCIFELGTNSPGEIEKLARATIPDISIITNVNPSHLLGLGSLDGVLEEKLSLFYNTRKGGTVLVNADDPLISTRYRNDGRLLLTYGMARDSHFNLEVGRNLGWEGNEITLNLQSHRIKTKTSLLGTHNLYNLLAAAALAYTAGINPDHIAEAVEDFVSYSMRFKPVTTGSGVVIIDDTYNANPSSMKWAIRTLLELPATGKRAVILGGMRELGEKSAEYHRHLGKFLKQSGIPLILLIGQEMKDAFSELEGTGARYYTDKGELIDCARKQLEKGDTVLVKGSRHSKMEEIVEALV